MNSTVNFTRKTYISRSDECDIGFSSEIYCGIHQLGNSFFFNRMGLKENKQNNPQRANGKEKSHFGVNCQKPASLFQASR